MNRNYETQVRLYASMRSWIECEAVRQLYAVGTLDGVSRVVGFPDLQPGRLTPTGAACVTQDWIYPHLIGDDVGCGMGLFKTDLVLSDAKLSRWAELPFDLESPRGEIEAEFFAENGVLSTEFDWDLGTIGHGNHFAELQGVEEVLDSKAFRTLGVGRKQLLMLIHSGSRSLGGSIQRGRNGQGQTEGLACDSFEAAEYLRDHDHALRWAKANRTLIASRFASALGVTSERVWDGCHNSITPQVSEGKTVWVHRKGAVAVDGSCVVIPGSRGSLSFLVKPIGDGGSHAWSLAHGAGRKWARSESRVRMRKRFAPQHLTQTSLGSRVICEERGLLYEEAPDAYKNIEDVIADMAKAGLVSVVATLRPLLTYKTRTLGL